MRAEWPPGQRREGNSWSPWCQGRTPAYILSLCGKESFLKKKVMCMCEHTLSHVQLFATLWTVACQAHLSREFSRQEYWSGWPCPSPGTKLPSLASPALAGRFFTTTWEAKERGTRDQIANIHRSQTKIGNSKKTSTSVSLTTRKPSTVRIMINCGKLLMSWEYQTI